MRGRAAFLVALALLTVGALCFRLPDRGNRPFHGDEAVHAFKFRDLWQRGVYRYDPNEYHGPTLYYAALPVVALRGRASFSALQESDLRLATVIAGAALVAALGLFADGLGKRATLAAALLAALSPALVFYSRYFIQETLLALFTLVFLGCAWRYSRRTCPGWAAGTGAAAGLMIATKETALFAFIAFAAAVGLTALWSRAVDRRPWDVMRLWNLRWVALAVVIALITASLFISGFLQNPAAPLDYVRAYLPWGARAGTVGLHRHSWNYYLEILAWTHRARGPVWSEGVVLALAAVGAAAALRPQSAGGAKLVRFLVFFTVTLTLIYSTIPYKTPWCVLSFLGGLLLLAGVGADALLRLAPGFVGKGAVLAVLLAGVGQLGWLSYQTSYVYPTDGRNPYVYAQPSPDVANLAQRVADLAHASPQGDALTIQVVSADEYYWPLPWYLRRFPHVGYWTTLPADARAPIVLASPEFDEALTRRLEATHLMTGYFGLRPSATFEMFVSLDLWQRYLKERKPPLSP